MLPFMSFRFVLQNKTHRSMRLELNAAAVYLVQICGTNINKYRSMRLELNDAAVYLVQIYATKHREIHET